MAQVVERRRSVRVGQVRILPFSILLLSIYSCWVLINASVREAPQAFLLSYFLRLFLVVYCVGE